MKYTGSAALPTPGIQAALRGAIGTFIALFCIVGQSQKDEYGRKGEIAEREALFLKSIHECRLPSNLRSWESPESLVHHMLFFSPRRHYSIVIYASKIRFKAIRMNLKHFEWSLILFPGSCLHPSIDNLHLFQQ